MDNQIHLLPFWLGFKRTLAEYKRAFPQIWQIALPVIALSIVSEFLLRVYTPGVTFGSILGLIIGIIAIFLNFIVVPGILISSIGNEQPFNLKEAYTKLLRKSPVLLLYIVLSIVVLLPTTLFFFIPGIFFAVVLGFTIYSYLLGTKYHQNPLVDSYLHVRGFFWPVFYRSLLAAVFTFLSYAGAYLVLIVLLLVAGFVFHRTGFLSPTVLLLVGDMLLRVFMILVPTPLYYLYGRTLFRDLENARGYTYTDEEKKRASQVVLWTPIVSLIGAGILIFALLTSAANLDLASSAKSNLQQSRDRDQVERWLPTRGLNR